MRNVGSQMQLQEPGVRNVGTAVEECRNSNAGARTSVRNVGTAVDADQPVELIEATESARSTGFSDQCASAHEPRTYVFRLRQLGLAGWLNAHPWPSYSGFKRL